jgi:hypothetical protein
MRKFVATTLGILVATLTVSGIGQAQGFTTVQGTIQAVDCQTNALVLRAPDGTHVFPAGPSTAVFVNSTPVRLCALQQYIGSSATVAVAPYGNQWVAERVDVYIAATPGPPYPAPAPAPTYSTAPPWLGIVLGTIIVGGIVYLLVRGHDGAVHRYPYSRQYDQQYGPYYGPYPYRYDPYQYDPYQYDPYRYDPYQRGPYQRGPYGYGPYQYGPYQQCYYRVQGPGCGGRDGGDSNR